MSMGYMRLSTPPFGTHVEATHLTFNYSLYANLLSLILALFTHASLFISLSYPLAHVLRRLLTTNLIEELDMHAP
jgi:hypothetical protein